MLDPDTKFRFPYIPYEFGPFSFVAIGLSYFLLGYLVITFFIEGPVQWIVVFTFTLLSVIFLRVEII